MQITIKVSASGVKNAQEEIRRIVQSVMTQVQSRGERASVVLENTEKIVLNNPSPSAPGSPPGVRTGALRGDQGGWTRRVEGSIGASGGTIRPTIICNVKYAPYLENGTRRMAARPFKDRIISEAAPRISAIFGEPYA